MAKEIKQKLVLDIQANLKQFQQAADSMNASFSKIGLGKGDLRQVATLYQRLSDNISNLSNITLGDININDAKKVQKIYEQIENDLKVMSNMRVGLKTDDILPQGLQTKLDDAKDAITRFSTTFARLQKQTQAKSNMQIRFDETSRAIKETTKNLDDLQKKQKKALTVNVEGQTFNYGSLSSIRGAATKAETANDTKKATALRKAITEYEKLSKTIQKTQEQLNKATSNQKQASEHLTQLTQDVKELEAALGGGTKEQGLAALKKVLKDITGQSFDTAEGLEDIQDILDKFKESKIQAVAREMDNLEKQTDDVGKAIKGAEAKMYQFSDAATRLREFTDDMDQMKRRIGYFFTLGNAIQLVKRAITQAYDSVKELDAAMTETAVVSEYTIDDMWKTLPEKTAQANKYGASIKGVYEVETLYYQQGLKSNEVTAVGAETLKMARIAGMDYTEATDAMTAALRGFNLEVNELNSTRVNDVYSALAALTASNVQELSSAMSKTASISASAGMQFETTSAFLAKIIETTRESAETAGTAMKTIVARFTEIKNNPNTTFEDADGEIVDVNKIDAALRSVGVSLKDSEGQIRNLDEVFLELGERWDSLDKNTQRYIATIAAGSRQQSRFIAMMSDYERTLQLVNIAQNSTGASQKQFAKTEESLAVLTQKLRNEWDQFVRNLANQDAIKIVIKALTIVLQLVNQLTTGFGLLSGGVGSFMITLTLLVSTFRLLSKLKDKYGDSFFGGITKLLHPQELKKGVEKGTTEGAETAAPIVKKTLGNAAYEAGLRFGKGVTDSTKSTKKKTTTSRSKSTRRKNASLDIESVNKKTRTANKATTPKQSFGQKASSTLKSNWANTKGSAKKIGENIKGAFSSKGAIGSTLTSMKPMLYATVASIGMELGQKIVSFVTDSIKNNTASAKLSKLTENLDSVNQNLADLQTTIDDISNVQKAYEDQVAIMRIANKTSKEYTKAQKEANKTIRNLVAQNPELRKSTMYKDGQWTVNESFWTDYENLLNKQQIELERTQSALEMGQAALAYESARDDNVRDLNSISSTEADNIATAGAVGGTVGGIAGGIAGGAVLGAAIGSVIPVPVLGTAIGILLGVVAGAIVGGLASTGVANIAATAGMDTEIFNSYIDKISAKRSGDFTTDELENFIKGMDDDSESYKEMEAIFAGATDNMQQFFKAFDGNVDTLNSIINNRILQKDQLKEQIQKAGEELGLNQAVVNEIQNMIDLEDNQDLKKRAENELKTDKLDDADILSTGKSGQSYAEAYMQQAFGAKRAGNKYFTAEGTELRAEDFIDDIRQLYLSDLLLMTVGKFSSEATNKVKHKITGTYAQELAKTNLAAGLGADKLNQAGLDDVLLKDIGKTLGDKAKEIFAQIDFSTDAGIYKFINSLEDAGIDIESKTDKTAEELAKSLIKASDAAQDFAKKVTYGTHFTSAIQSLSLGNRGISDEQYNALSQSYGLSANDFIRQGEQWYYIGNDLTSYIKTLIESAGQTLTGYRSDLLLEKEGYTTTGYLQSLLNYEAYDTLVEEIGKGVLTDTEIKNSLIAVASKSGITDDQIEGTLNSSTGDLSNRLSTLVTLIKKQKFQEIVSSVGDAQRTIADALAQQAQNAINALEDVKSTIEDQNSKIISEMRTSITQLRQDRENEKAEKELSQQENELAYLMANSNTSQLDLLEKQQELTEAQQSYADQLVDQKIDELEKNGEEQIQKLQTQIELQKAIHQDNLDNGAYIQQAAAALTDFTKNKEILKAILKVNAGYNSMTASEQTEFDNRIDALFAPYEKELQLESGTGIEVDTSSAIINTKEALEDYVNNHLLASDKGRWGEDSTYQILLKKYIDAGGNITDLNLTGKAKTPTQSSDLDWRSEWKSKNTGLSDIKNFSNHKYSLPVVGIADYNLLNTGNLNKNTTPEAALYDGMSYDTAVKFGLVDNYTRNEWNRYRNKNRPSYKTGGLADFTGPAWLDGTKAHPEIVLNQHDSQNFLELKDTLASLKQNGMSQISGDNYYEIDIKVDSIGSDYDVDRLANRIKQSITNDAKYRNVNAINLIR